MHLSRRNVIVFLMTIILLLVIQLVRFDLFLNLNSLENTPAYDYRREANAELLPDERGTFRKRSCLIIYTESQLDELTNVVSVLQIMQFRHDTMKSGDRREQYNDYDLIIIFDQENEQLADREQIIRYAKDGGRILYLGSGNELQGSILTDNALLFGIKDWGNVVSASGIVFHTEILSGLIGETELNDVNGTLNNVFNLRLVSLSEGCHIHVSDKHGYPLIWECREDGSIMVMNIGSLDDRRMRGLLTGAISVFMGTVIYPITQSAVYQIVNVPLDDQIESEFLEQSYNRNFSQYILDIWWQDMVFFMKKYKLKYSVAFGGLYYQNEIDSFSANKKSADNFGILSKMILRNHGEIIFQGLNCQDTPYLQGPAIETVEDAIRHSAVILQNLMPNYTIRAYAHSGYLIDDQAYEALDASFPDITVISSPWFYRPHAGECMQQDSCYQEFSVNENGNINFPQVTGGYIFDDRARFDLASVVTTHGLISHVIKADEILNATFDSGLYWEDMYKQYAALFMEISETYPWLSNDTISTAAAKLDQSSNLDLYYSVNDHTINIVTGRFSHEATLILVTEHEIIGSEGCDYIRIDSIRYLITLHEKTASLEVRS